MAQYRGSQAFYEIGQLLVDGVREQLALSYGGDVQRACLVPGEIAWDGCDCGLLAVTVRRWFVTDQFPEGFQGQGAARATPCDLPWLVGQLHIQVIRCAPSGLMIEVPCVELDEAARVLISDAYVALTETIAILCGLREEDRIIDYVVGEQETYGPDGGCVGTEVSALVALVR